MNEFNPDIKPKFSPSGESERAVIRWGIIGVGSVTEMKKRTGFLQNRTLTPCGSDAAKCEKSCRLC